MLTYLVLKSIWFNLLSPDPERKHTVSSEPALWRRRAFRNARTSRAYSMDSSGDQLDLGRRSKAIHSIVEYYDPTDSPGHRIKPRKARKGTRRTKSVLDAHMEPKVLRLDPREACEFPGIRERTRQMSLPENSKIVPLDPALTSQFNPDIEFSSPARPTKLAKSSDLDISSLSSYKETSPECEISPEQAASMPQLRQLDESVSNFISGSFRSRTQAPSSRSLETQLRRTQSNADQEDIPGVVRNRYSDRGLTSHPHCNVSEDDVADASDVTIIDETSLKSASSLTHRPSSIKSNVSNSSHTLKEESVCSDNDSPSKQRDKKCLVFKLPAVIQGEAWDDSTTSATMGLDMLFGQFPEPGIMTPGWQACLNMCLVCPLCFSLALSGICCFIQDTVHPSLERNYVAIFT